MVSSVEGCLSCDFASGRRALPGGRLYETDFWIVEHCIGPLGLGALIVKPKRHVVHLWELTAPEADELGPLLRRAATAVAEFSHPEQVYIGLWSHAGRRPGHIHFVVQPVTPPLVEEFGAYGPGLQAAMFERGVTPADEEIDRIAPELRRLLQA